LKEIKQISVIKQSVHKASKESTQWLILLNLSIFHALSHSLTHCLYHYHCAEQRDKNKQMQSRKIYKILLRIEMEIDFNVCLFIVH